MIEVNLTWTDEEIWDFVKFYTLRKSKWQRISSYIFIGCAVFLFLFAIIVYIMTKTVMYLAVIGISILMVVLFGLMLYITMRSLKKELVKANEPNRDMKADLSSNQIFLHKSNAPYGYLEWDSIGEIYIEQKAVYLISKENALLLLSYANIVGSGTKEELLKLLDEKKDHLPKPTKNEK